MSLLYALKATNMQERGKVAKKFVLITVLYNETNHDRIQEYINCLKNNLEHPLISQIHVFYDSSKDGLTEEHIIRDFLNNHNVTINDINGRVTYGDCFALANELYVGQSVIISNADIYFNDSLSKLVDYDLTNKFLALTRWNVRSDGKVVPYNVAWRRISQDTWIFEAPIRKFENDHIYIGTLECDSFIAYEAQKAGMQVLNPCLTVQCCHLHLSNIRNYDVNKHNKLPVGYRPARWSRL